MQIGLGSTKLFFDGAHESSRYVLKLMQKFREIKRRDSSDNFEITRNAMLLMDFGILLLDLLGIIT